MISLCSAVVDFLLLIVVFNIGVHSLRNELCSLYSAMCYCCLFVFFPVLFFFLFFFLTGMKPDYSFDVLLVWMTVTLMFERVLTAYEGVALCRGYVELVL